jgi:hypothetical protein
MVILDIGINVIFKLLFLIANGEDLILIDAAMIKYASA